MRVHSAYKKRSVTDCPSLVRDGRPPLSGEGRSPLKENAYL
jgi:hypothetical protein